MTTLNARGILCSHSARDTASQPKAAWDVAPRARGLESSILKPHHASWLETSGLAGIRRALQMR